MDKHIYLNLDIRALHTFLIIMETGSITATANRLNVTHVGGEPLLIKRNNC
uniref:HTH lysR-type domain-containing protein n=1 Tax=uncultured Thiotrichaceae bacterium TaxID=298394 RepID=A0A6S6TM48_9GAMM|nr:MAG: Unknown protein [uncultured Thiotrichaceae bacterium]